MQVSLLGQDSISCTRDEVDDQDMQRKATNSKREAVLSRGARGEWASYGREGQSCELAPMRSQEGSGGCCERTHPGPRRQRSRVRDGF